MSRDRSYVFSMHVRMHKSKRVHVKPWSTNKFQFKSTCFSVSREYAMSFMSFYRFYVESIDIRFFLCESCNFREVPSMRLFLGIHKVEFIRSIPERAIFLAIYT